MKNITLLVFTLLCFGSTITWGKEPKPEDFPLEFTVTWAVSSPDGSAAMHLVRGRTEYAVSCPVSFTRCAVFHPGTVVHAKVGKNALTQNALRILYTNDKGKNKVETYFIGDTELH